MSPALDSAILAVLKDGPKQSAEIVTALRLRWDFRTVDRGVQKLRRAKRITLLPRLSGVRPFPLWEKVP